MLLLLTSVTSDSSISILSSKWLKNTATTTIGNEIPVD